jgi:hypothetical protein
MVGTFGWCYSFRFAASKGRVRNILYSDDVANTRSIYMLLAIETHFIFRPSVSMILRNWWYSNWIHYFMNMIWMNQHSLLLLLLFYADTIFSNVDVSIISYITHIYTKFFLKFLPKPEWCQEYKLNFISIQINIHDPNCSIYWAVSPEPWAPAR